MIFHLFFFIVGLAILYFGAKGLVGGASRLASFFGIRPIIIGITIVAFGTSAPEASVCIIAAIKETKDVAIGTIIGSNIANIGLILGLSALVSPLKIDSAILRKELPIMIITTLAIYILAMDGKIGFYDGLLLFSGIIVFVVFCYLSGRKDSSYHVTLLEFKQGTGAQGKNIALCIGGILALIGSAHLIINSALFLAKTFGISEFIIGVSLVAFGTSLPELATAIVASYRKEADICLGNVIGSNIFNILFVVGLVAMITPFYIEKRVLIFQFPIMLLFSIILIPMMKKDFILSRKEGVGLFLGYIAFMVCLFNSWIRDTIGFI
ncbi:MAG: calcium/sodium antiporter [Thermodesulfobacteriota bacterium]|nr:calcium/sodium antiporter [Thermodesulfobacteriota bacterium]